MMIINIIVLATDQFLQTSKVQYPASVPSFKSFL